jgi:hypothetical protein
MIDAAEELDLRVDHFEARGAHLVDFGFAVEDEELALLEAALDITAVKKFEGHEAGVNLHEEMVNGVGTARGAYGLAAHDAGANGVDAIGLDVFDIAEMDAVFVTEGQIEEEIFERVDAALGQEFGALWAYTF